MKDKGVFMFCLTCNRKDYLKKTGSYIYEKIKYDIFLCRYCRAGLTKFNNKLKKKEIKKCRF